MQVPYGEGQASHAGPESCVGTREGDGEALTGVRAGRVSSPENPIVRGADARCSVRKATPIRLLYARPGRTPRDQRPRARTQAPRKEEHPSVRKPGGPRLGPPLVPARLVRVMNP